MNHIYKTNRRSFVIGSAGVLAIPYLPSLASAAPVRKNLVVLYMPNGVYPSSWNNYQAQSGQTRSLSTSLEPLTEFQNQLTIVRNLYLEAGTAGTDGTGDHARAASAYLTCKRPYKTEGQGIRVGRSIDHELADQLSTDSRIPLLALGVDRPDESNCDTGYACVYSKHLSWRTASTPQPTIYEPQRLFDLLFPGEDEHARQLAARDRKRSVLDHVTAEISALRQHLDQADRNKLEEYTDSVRGVERMLANMPEERPTTNYLRPGETATYFESLPVMMDLICLALESRSTPIASLMLGNEISAKQYHHLGIQDGHHYLSHHGNDAAKIEKIEKIDRYHAELAADLLQKMQGRDLLGETVVVLGAGINDGNLHDNVDIPTLVIGGGIRGNREIQTGEGTPLANLWLGVADHLGAGISSFADSNGVVEL